MNLEIILFICFKLIVEFANFQLANMLGYPTHTSYATELLMSKSAEVVHKFLLELLERFRPLWKEEKEYLLELKEKEVSIQTL